jgi:hypothetical protein
MGLPQHSTSPSPALVINTSALQTSQRNLLPNRFGMSVKAPFLLSVWLNTAWNYDFFSIGCLQQITCPLPALVTISSVPHLAQRYLFPISFAIFCTAFQIAIIRAIIILAVYLVNFLEAP